MAKNAIRSDFRMISGCNDTQTSADVSHIGSFQLPDPAGRAGGACTSALLSILYANERRYEGELSFGDVLFKLRDVLDERGFSQIPQLSSSRMIDVDNTVFDISHCDYRGTKRAIMIGINYVGQEGQLSGCHNDVLNMKDYLMDVHEFEEENIMMLMDDGMHIEPTCRNIIHAYQKIVQLSQPGDIVYLHYSGHGGKQVDYDGDEEDGYDETLIPVDFQTNGVIVDDDLLKYVVLPMKAGVLVTSVMDCCHSGTVLDLPFNFKADGVDKDMQEDESFGGNCVIS